MTWQQQQQLLLEQQRQQQAELLKQQREQQELLKRQQKQQQELLKQQQQQQLAQAAPALLGLPLSSVAGVGLPGPPPMQQQQRQPRQQRQQQQRSMQQVTAPSPAPASNVQRNSSGPRLVKVSKRKNTAAVAAAFVRGLADCAARTSPTASSTSSPRGSEQGETTQPSVPDPSGTPSPSSRPQQWTPPGHAHGFTTALTA